MTAMRAESNRRRRRHEEHLEVQKAINSLRENFKDSFINFRGLDIKKDYQTIVVARQEIKNIFGRLKSSRNIIIGFHKHLNISNKKESATESAITDLNKPIWKIYEIEVEAGKSLESTLDEKCRGFELDQNLIQKELAFKQEWLNSINRQIEDFERNGLTQRKISLSSPKSNEDQSQNRGFKI